MDKPRWKDEETNRLYHDQSQIQKHCNQSMGNTGMAGKSDATKTTFSDLHDNHTQTITKILCT